MNILTKEEEKKLEEEKNKQDRLDKKEYIKQLLLFIEKEVREKRIVDINTIHQFHIQSPLIKEDKITFNRISNGREFEELTFEEKIEVKSFVSSYQSINDNSGNVEKFESLTDFNNGRENNKFKPMLLEMLNICFNSNEFQNKFALEVSNIIKNEVMKDEQILKLGLELEETDKYFAKKIFTKEMKSTLTNSFALSDVKDVIKDKDVLRKFTNGNITSNKDVKFSINIGINELTSPTFFSEVGKLIEESGDKTLVNKIHFEILEYQMSLLDEMNLKEHFERVSNPNNKDIRKGDDKIINLMKNVELINSIGLRINLDDVRFKFSKKKAKEVMNKTELVTNDSPKSVLTASNSINNRINNCLNIFGEKFENLKIDSDVSQKLLIGLMIPSLKSNRTENIEKLFEENKYLKLHINKEYLKEKGIEFDETVDIETILFQESENNKDIFKNIFKDIERKGFEELLIISIKNKFEIEINDIETKLHNFKEKNQYKFDKEYKIYEEKMEKNKGVDFKESPLSTFISDFIKSEMQDFKEREPKRKLIIEFIEDKKLAKNLEQILGNCSFQGYGFHANQTIKRMEEEIQTKLEEKQIKELENKKNKDGIKN